MARTAALCGDELVIYSGEDNQTLPILSLGGKGVISVLANVVPAATHKMCADYLAGNTEAARTAFLKYLELMDALFMDVNPIPVKAAMEMMKLNCGGCRLPLAPLSEDAQEKLGGVLKKYGLI